MHYAQKSNGLYVLYRNDIERIAVEILKRYAPSNLCVPKPLNTTDFLENYLGLVVKNRYICDFGSGILGLTVMGDIVPIPSYDEFLRPVILEETFGTVLISPLLLKRNRRPRRRYTEMHEAAHFILHRPYFERCERTTGADSKCPCTFIACRKVERDREEIRTDLDWLEYQADALAAALLMPRDAFAARAQEAFRENGIRGQCMVVGKYDNRTALHRVIYQMAETFFVSYRAARIRMYHLGLIREYQ